MAGVTRVGDGMYRVEVDGHSELVYVAGTPNDRWVFWNGHVYRGDFTDRHASAIASAPLQRGRASARQAPASARPFSEHASARQALSARPFSEHASARQALSARPFSEHASARQALSAPMPATVLKVLVAPGQSVKKGDTIIVLEAMKMELPLRALGDAVVTAVRCREGELVQAEATLVEFE